MTGSLRESLCCIFLIQTLMRSLLSLQCHFTISAELLLIQFPNILPGKLVGQCSKYVVLCHVREKPGAEARMKFLSAVHSLAPFRMLTGFGGVNQRVEHLLFLLLFASLLACLLRYSVSLQSYKFCFRNIKYKE